MRGQTVSFLVVVVGLAAVGATQVRGQAPAVPTERPAFEVASIKPDKSGDDRSYASLYPGGRFSVTNASLKGLILSTYRVDVTRVVGGPSWIDADRFDVEAKSPEGSTPTPDQLNAMMKTLLADRFQLRVHEEARELTVYALVNAQTKGASPGLTPASTGNCANLVGPPEKGPRPTTSPNGQPWCGRVVFSPTGWSARAVTPEQIAKALEPFVGRLVVNRTNIVGAFDVDLAFNPRVLAVQANDVESSPRQSDASTSIFTALQEQLGLKLEAAKSPANVLVVDHAEHPTAD